jgi:hypothetical protein
MDLTTPSRHDVTDRSILSAYGIVNEWGVLDGWSTCQLTAPPFVHPSADTFDVVTFKGDGGELDPIVAFDSTTDTFLYALVHDVRLTLPQIMEYLVDPDNTSDLDLDALYTRLDATDI